MARQANGVHDKVVVVSRVDRGFGREAALLFAQEGARVVLGIPPSNDKCVRLARDLAFDAAEFGSSAVVSTADGSTEAGAKRTIELALSTFGRIDVVLDDGGSSPPSGAQHCPPDLGLSSEAAAALSRVGPVSKFVVPFFIRQRAGSFIHSIDPGTTLGHGRAFGEAKSDLSYLSSLIAREMEKYNVRSNCVFASDASWILRGTRARMEGTNVMHLREKLELNGLARLSRMLVVDGADGVTGGVFEVQDTEITLLDRPTPRAFAAASNRAPSSETKQLWSSSAGCECEWTDQKRGDPRQERSIA